MLSVVTVEAVVGVLLAVATALVALRLLPEGAEAADLAGDEL